MFPFALQAILLAIFGYFMAISGKFMPLIPAAWVHF
jgi:hypothetical protein